MEWSDTPVSLKTYLDWSGIMDHDLEFEGLNKERTMVRPVAFSRKTALQIALGFRDEVSRSGLDNLNWGSVKDAMEKDEWEDKQRIFYGQRTRIMSKPGCTPDEYRRGFSIADDLLGEPDNYGFTDADVEKGNDLI